MPSSSRGRLQGDRGPGWVRVRGDRLHRAAIAGALGLLTLVAFLPSLGNGFVATWDDGPNLLENPHLRGFGWPSFSWAWRTFLLGVYQPLAWLLFFAQYAVWGLEPWGYHLVSLLWACGQRHPVLSLDARAAGACPARPRGS